MIPLHNHTHYSILDGLSRPEEIARRCKEIDAFAAACTDHGVVAGHPDFYRVLTQNGLKPILGIEAYQSLGNRFVDKGSSYHLVLLAKNNEGLKNLWRLITEANRTGFYRYPRVDWALLEQHRDGLICTSACAGSILSKALSGEIDADPASILNEYLGIFRDSFYVEISTYDSPSQRELNVQLVDLARSRGVPIVYANDAHYSWPSQYEMYDSVVMSLQKKTSENYHPNCLYIMEESEVRSRLSYLPPSVIDEAIGNSDVIAHMCNVSLPEKKYRIPRFSSDGYSNNLSFLLERLYEGFEKFVLRAGKDEEIYWARLKKELEIIREANLVDYILIVNDYIDWARNHGVMVGPGRGSVGGSLVAYLLGITEVDPIKYGLIFERFYNPGRKGSLPDIDTDFDVEGRELVKKYIAWRWGSDRVADIGNIVTLGPKGAIRDVARALSIPLDEVAKITELIDTTTDAGQTASWDEIHEEIGDQLLPYMQKWPLLFEWAQELHSYIRSYSIHASAVIISNEQLDSVFPLRWVASKERLVSQWDMREAENMGFLKMDLLGLRNLSTLQEVNNVLVESGKDPINYSELLNDDVEFPEEMWQLIDRGLSVGLFQIDSSTAKDIAMQIKPRSIEDLAVVIALNRPGPLRSGAIDVYISRRNSSSEKTEYVHPFLEDVLKETYGVFIYQEQIINFMTKIGYSLEEADEVRSLIGKKKIDRIASEKERYMTYATNYMSEREASEIWNQIVTFAKYGFNKSHAIEYAIILLWCLWAKYFHTKEFLLAGIRTSEPEDQHRFLEEALRLDIKILPPDVNRSDVRTTLCQEGILFGLTSIKYIGVSHAKWIIANRPFESIDDFRTKVEVVKGKTRSGQERAVLDKRRIEILQQVGAFDSIEGSSYDLDQRRQYEKEYLGVVISDNSSLILQHNLDLIKSDCVAYSEINGLGVYRVAGVIRDVKFTRAKKTGKDMAFVKISFDVDQLTFVVWEEKLKRYKFLLKEYTPAIFDLKKTRRGLQLERAVRLCLN